MTENHAPWPIEYDEMNKRWKVRLESRVIDCDSERDAQLISSIPCLYAKLNLNDNSAQHDCSFRNILQHTVDLINNYLINNWVTRKIQSRYKEISQKYQTW